jgi:hypothetical protein
MSLQTSPPPLRKMNSHETKLPWNDAKVLSTGNLHDYLAEKISNGASRHLPASVTLLFDPDISKAQVESFLEQLCTYLPGEFEAREQRVARFVDLGLLEEGTVGAFLTDHRDAQPWLIYYSKDGGLGSYDQGAYRRQADVGMVPCFAMRNHGVAWQKTHSGAYSTSLTTSRKASQDWDWDSDVGHESAHAAFSPVPLFTLPSEEMVPANLLSGATSARALRPKQLAWICYLCCELAVVSMRGERRETESGLPATEGNDHYPALLSLCDELMPGIGFGRALKAFNRVGGVINCNTGDEILEIGAPAIRAVALLWPEFNKFAVPSLDWFDHVVARHS